MAEKKWRIKSQDQAICNKIADQLKIDPIIAHLLLNRQITSLNQAKEFISSARDKTQSFPSEWIDAAVAILTALPKQATILLYGDYDVDGITSTTLSTEILTACGFNVEFYIPHRFNDGYGLGSNIFDLVEQHKPDLVMTLDCGITNVNEFTQLKTTHPSIKIMILDHHKIPETQPPADVIINPKALPNQHPLSELCTAGIAYVFFEAIITKLSIDVDIKKQLDLVALGTIADVAILKDENRRLTILGLNQLAKQPRPGIKALLDVSDHQSPTVTVRDIGFGIAPRLNAAGRLADARICVDLLLKSSIDEAMPLATKLNTLNMERQAIGKQIMAEIETYLAENPSILHQPAIVVAGRNWHRGIIGIAAARLSDTYHRPTIIISYDDETATGSARSIPTVDVYELIKTCAHHCLKFGGHRQAAGFSLKPDMVTPFIDDLRAASIAMITEEQLVPIIDIDCKITEKHLNLDMTQSLAQLEPFGHGNPAPVFYTNALTAVDYRLVGNGAHLKATFTDHTNTVVIDAIGFKLADKLPKLKNKPCELVFQLERNHWRGTDSAQLNLIDIK